MKTPKFDLDKELEKCSTIEDLCGKNGLVQKLIGGMLETFLEKEMEEHVGYEKHSPQGKNTGNSRNGTVKKTVHSSYGPIELSTPRDRNGEFQPRIVRKRQKEIGSFDEKIISMYARGMSTRDIQSHVEELYGAHLSPTMISSITDKVMGVAKEWQTRPLEKVYPITYFDAIHYKVKENGKVVTKAVYTCLGIDLEGKKEVLGLWIGEQEGARFWLSVFTELKNRGVEDIFIACVDGLKGLPEAIASVFPQAEIQLCVIHLIRSSLKYMPYKHSKEFTHDLKNIYRAETEEKAERYRDILEEKWGSKYPLAVRGWTQQWENIRTFFKFPEEIRRIIYTTNAVEALHRHFRKTTKTKAVFPTDDALFKLLFLSVNNLSEKWTKPLKGWKNALSQFAILYEGRL